MHLKDIPHTLLLIAVASMLSACSASPPTQGIAVSSRYCIGDSNARPVLQCLPGSQIIVVPNIPVWGNEWSDYYVNDGDDTEGTVGFFGNNGDPPASTGKDGVLIVNNAKAPAYWDVTWLEPWECGMNTNPSDGPVYRGPVTFDNATFWEFEAGTAFIQNYYPNKSTYTFTCLNYGSLDSDSKRLVIQGNAPSTITLGSSAPLTTNNGMPLLYVYNESGSLVSTETATSVSGDGSQATFPFPSTLPPGGYSLAIVNENGYAAGVNLLSVASSQTIAGNPFGVAASGQTTTVETCVPITIGHNTHLQCTGASNYSTFPVISLYSQGQVLIDNTPVNVGPNPTAVAAFPAGTVVKEQNGPDFTDVSGMTGAIVANSGSDTVSVLDLVHDDVKATITVGNQPVALAVSSNGSTAYVANYGDSTITSINLTDDTVGTTVAVGGNPTSLALTSSGVLWVGGAGFLTEINTSNMTVTATESTGGKTIIGLGYSDAEGQLAATTVDASGNVYADLVNPATVTAGGSYQPTASTLVSTVPQHLNTRTNSEVRSFTATLASSPVLNLDQPGAPPMVVQDGWAVVTVTPTGFTISNIENGSVLVSETTPSPVTGVAVDPTLSAAYLVMPDSNTLLTVPLPGVAPAVPSQ